MKRADRSPRDREEPRIDCAVDPEAQASLFLSVSATLIVPAQRWRLGNQSAEIKRLADRLAQCGCLEEFKVHVVEAAAARRDKSVCTVCGWVHDTGLTQIRLECGTVVRLHGVLPRIVSLVHQAHEMRLDGLSTKDDTLLELCAGYRHPCKAFDDLKHRGDYKLLFDTHRRGFISLRGGTGRNRNKSESSPE